jgi:hypothetical protein
VALWLSGYDARINTVAMVTKAHHQTKTPEIQSRAS